MPALARTSFGPAIDSDYHTHDVSNDATHLCKCSEIYRAPPGKTQVQARRASEWIRPRLAHSLTLFEVALFGSPRPFFKGRVAGGEGFFTIVLPHRIARNSNHFPLIPNPSPPQSRGRRERKFSLALPIPENAQLQNLRFGLRFRRKSTLAQHQNLRVGLILQNSLACASGLYCKTHSLARRACIAKLTRLRVGLVFSGGLTRLRIGLVFTR